MHCAKSIQTVIPEIIIFAFRHLADTDKSVGLQVIFPVL